MRDPDAWLSKPQPTPELCRLYHGIDCRRCVDVFAPLDKIVAYQAHAIADEWKQKFQERLEWERKLDRVMAKERGELP